MRALFELIEMGALIVRKKDLEEKLDADSLAAFRSAGILRPTDDGKNEEISPSDFMRTLRVLYGIEARGLPLPGVFDRNWQAIGWIRDEDGDRDVILVAQPTRALHIAVHSRNRALLLVPTARAVTKKQREQHGPGRWVHIEVLEEALSTKGGRLSRAGKRAPHAFAPSLATSTPSRLPRAPTVRITGAQRWNQVRMCLVNQRTIRIDVPGKSIRVTHVDMGMANSRNREPTRLWEALVEICEENGYFKTRRFGGTDATKKLLSRLRQALRELFSLDEPPFEPYRGHSGWKTRFQARPDLPDEFSDASDRDD
jgi:hypothetical protein